jgi:hypothetical protein
MDQIMWSDSGTCTPAYIQILKQYHKDMITVFH